MLLDDSVHKMNLIDQELSLFLSLSQLIVQMHQPTHYSILCQPIHHYSINVVCIFIIYFLF